MAAARIRVCSGRVIAMPGTADAAPIVLTRGADAPWSGHRSGMSIQFGVSGELSGSHNVFMTHQRIPPGMESAPHVHTNCRDGDVRPRRPRPDAPRPRA